MLLPILLPLLRLHPALGSSMSSRATPFDVPASNGGSQLDVAAPSLGEPLNVMISGLSSPQVLTDDGFLNWARSIGFSTECFGIHAGAPQTANLGDGNGFVPQRGELRQDFGSAALGTCLESLLGGNHLRYWKQSGPLSNSGALFLAVSQEENVQKGHTISPNGYDLGRDKLVRRATEQNTTFGGVTYMAVSATIAGLLPVGSAGINHGIALDGNVVLLTVLVLESVGGNVEAAVPGG